MSEPSSRSADRGAMREQFLRHAGAAFDLMFHPEHQADLVSFDQRESRVVELMRDLGSWLLQRQTNADPAARPPEGPPVACPKCGRAGQRLTGPDDPLPSRPLTTLTGPVHLERAKFTCTTCRVVFSPPRR